MTEQELWEQVKKTAWEADGAIQYLYDGPWLEPRYREGIKDLETRARETQRRLWMLNQKVEDLVYWLGEYQIGPDEDEWDEINKIKIGGSE